MVTKFNKGGFYMDIAALSMVLSQSKVRQQATLSVMDKAMGQAEENGQNLIHLLEQSSVPQPAISLDPNVGNSIDIKA